MFVIVFKKLGDEFKAAPTIISGAWTARFWLVSDFLWLRLLVGVEVLLLRPSLLNLHSVLG